MAIGYRKIEGRDVWHFCSNCSNWPTKKGTYKERSSRPKADELCNECRSKKANHNCD